MAKYRKKPITVEAEQFYFEQTPWPKGVEVTVADECDPCHAPPGTFLWAFITTLEGKRMVFPGDWIVTYPNGEKRSYESDVFEMTYESMEQVAEDITKSLEDNVRETLMTIGDYLDEEDEL